MKDSHITVIVLPNQIKTFVCFLAYGFSLTQIDRLRLSRNVLGNKIRSRLRSVRYLSLIFVVAIVCARPDEDNVFFIASCGHRVLEKHIIYVWVLFLFIQTWKKQKAMFWPQKISYDILLGAIPQTAFDKLINFDTRKRTCLEKQYWLSGSFNALSICYILLLFYTF